MEILGNLIWLFFGGIVIAAIYYVEGLVMCLTIIGIPFGVQLFKLGTYSLWPFGHDLVDRPGPAGCAATLMNLLWILTGWWQVCILHVILGLLCFVTIVGIPWGVQHFKMAAASILPFGKEIQ